MAATETGYATITLVQSADPHGLTPGGAVTWNAVVLDANSMPVSVPGAAGAWYSAGTITFTVGHGDSQNAIDNAIIAAVQTLYQNPSMTVVIL